MRQIESRGTEIGAMGIQTRKHGSVVFGRTGGSHKKRHSGYRKGMRRYPGGVSEVRKGADLDTLRIARKCGLDYSSNLCDDDRPYVKDLEDGESILEIPIHWVNYDLPFFAFNYHPAFPAGQGRIAGYSGVLSNWKDEFDGCAEYGLCYVLQLDPAAIGAPGRIGMLEELLDYMLQYNVWFAAGSEMADYCRNK